MGSVYHISCEKQNWPTVYIGESERALKDRFQGRKRASNTPSEVFRHRYSDESGYTVSLKSAPGTNVV